MKVFHLASGLGPKNKDFFIIMLSKPPYLTYHQFIVASQAHEQKKTFELTSNKAKH